MLSESTAGGSRQSAKAQAFWFRLTDNLFRRLGWFLLPVVAMTLFGFMQASKTLELYQSTGTLSASTNPLVPSQQISGVTPNFWETPAGMQSRIINEQLRTDSFLGSVANDAGLQSQVDSGLLNLAVVRSSIWASPNGDSILSVNAQWNDPQTSYALVTATIATYQAYISETAASDSSQAETFWADQLKVIETDRDAAQTALTEHLLTLPELDEGEDYPIEVQIATNRLQNRLDALDGKLDATQGQLDEARLTRVQQTSEAVRSLNVVDKPQVPTAPVSTVMKRITLVASFMLLGFVIAAAALVVTTVLDQSVASPVDLLTLAGIALVATVPPVRTTDGRSGRLTRNSRPRLRPRSNRSAVS